MIEKFGKFLKTCKFCPNLCLERCSVFLAECVMTFSPFGKMKILDLISKGFLPIERETAEIFYKCTGCLSCFEGCFYKVNVEDALFFARRFAIENKIIPFSIENFIHNEEENLKTLKSFTRRKYWDEGFRVLYFPGCRAIQKVPEIIKHTFSLTNLLQMEFIGLSEASSFCCSYNLYAGGFHKEFEENAKRIVKQFQKYKAVVCASSCCAHTFKNIYPKFGLENLPLVRMAYEVIGNVILKENIEKCLKRVIYHDCCFTGRHLGDYEMPRLIIKHLINGEILEFYKNRKDSQCCGNAGAYKETSPMGAEIAGLNLIENASIHDADFFVTTSSSCISHLREVNKKNNFQIVDIVSFIYEVIKKNG